MATFLIDGTTELPESGDTGWGTTLNAAILSIDDRFTWSGGEAAANKVAASGITGTTLPATLVASSLTSVGTLSSLTVSGTVTVTGLTTGSTTFGLVNTTATTVNFAGAATTISIGASTGTTTVNNNLTVTGNLTVNGTTTTVNSTTLSVDDKNIVLADGASPSDAGADGGGITLKGTTDKTLNWVDSTDAWTSSEHLALAAGKAFYINGTGVLSSTTLGSGVVNSSLTSVGTIGTGTWQGTVIAGQYGGTGVANTGKTITLGGNLTTSGAYAVTFTVTGTTSVTLPTSGTLVATDTTTLSSLNTIGTITSGTWHGSIVAGEWGGTGVANTGKTITVSGNTQIGSNSDTVAFATSGPTNVSLPTTGTLATTMHSYYIGTTQNSLSRSSGSQTLTGVSIDGNAATATKLATARTINGVSFDGSANITIGFATLDDIGDVSVTGAATGEFLKWDGTAWINASVTYGAVASIDDITDVVITSPSSGDTLKWNGTQWVNGPLTETLGIHDLNDASISSPSTGQALIYNGTSWANTTVALLIDALSDVVITSAATGQFLRYDGTNWRNEAIHLGDDTIGNYVASLVAGTGVSITNNSGEGATPTIAIGQAVSTSSDVQFASVTATGTLTVTGETIIGPATIAAKTGSYTLVLADQGKVIEMNVATSNTVTVPPNSSVAFPIGSQITITQYGAGKVQVQGGSGVTVRGTPGLYLRAQYASATLIKRATDEWYLIGDLSAT